jgi:hypothetical protein
MRPSGRVGYFHNEQPSAPSEKCERTAHDEKGTSDVNATEDRSIAKRLLKDVIEGKQLTAAWR